MSHLDKPISRRQMLRLLGIGAGMVYLSGCGPAPATEAPAAAEATATPAAV